MMETPSNYKTRFRSSGKEAESQHRRMQVEKAERVGDGMTAAEIGKHLLSLAA